jgi:hypothetical protein
MGILDFLKHKWSAGEVTQEDRKKIFWLLKRKTSYTAWKREADAFDKFADIFEKQVMEEPIAKAGPLNIWDTNWETSYPEILKCQVLYEKALARLKQGDRSVFLYNERGLFIDADNISSSWYINMVHEGYHGDKSFDGKYVPQMKEALEEYALAAAHAGYTQSRMEGQAAPLTFNEVIFNGIAFPSFLDEVPEAIELVTVRTDEEIPVFGIYEPQIKDGCMNYLLGGTTAPVYSMYERRPVTWKLIWEDNRYLDGHIPSEEALYFPPQAKPAEQQPAFVGADLITASTGQTCPKDGHWAVMNDLQGKATFKKGDTMPQHQGRDVVWVWGG